MDRFIPKNATVTPLFRLGLSSIFLASSLVAWFSPNEFIELVKNNSLASAIAGPEFWIVIIGINDALLFFFILSGFWHRVIAVWAAFWMLGVMYITGFEFIELVEHVGLLFLVAYYYFAFRQSFVKV